MNFQATNLDAAYDSLSGLNTLASTQGQNLVDNLKQLIGMLKAHWKGSDATIHINKLIDVYTGVATLVQNVHIVAHNASGPIVNSQTIRNSNGGTGNVGEVISTGTGLVESIETLENTAEYYVDPQAAPNDLTKLTAEKGAFDRFCTQFSSLKEELLNNWTSGSDREKAVSDFEEFESQATSYKQIFTEVESNLSTAVSNLKQI